MDLRLVFDQIAEDYDRQRPLYTAQMFADILQFCGPDNKGQQALEIGIGTGQATRPFLQAGCRVTAVELGAHMAAVARKKYAAYPNLQVLQADFETVDLPLGRYDLIYSASAFQWIDPEIGFPKVYALLRAGGVFARFGHALYRLPQYAPLTAAMDEVYEKYRPQFYADPKISLDKVHPQYRQVLTSLQPPVPDQKSPAISFADQLAAHGFTSITYKTYQQVLNYDADSYVALLATNCDQLSLPAKTKQAFATEIRDIIQRHGGRYALSDTIKLYLAKKPSR